MPATVLFLSANPSGTRQLDLDEEYRDIEEERMRARLRDAFALRPVLAARIEDVRRALALHKPTVVHFGGHGLHAGPAAGGRDVRPIPGPGDRLGERTELLLNDEAGRPAPVPIEALAELFRLEGGSVHCVVLNACNSLAQAKAIAQHVDCAIGTSSPIRDKAAVAFSKGFYGALFNGDSIEKAFASGRNEVALLRLDDPKVYELCPRVPGTSEQLRLAELPKVQFRVPLARNPAFVGRDEELARLHRMLQDPQPGGRRPVLLTGMGGIGKTQLAVEVAFRHEASYPDGVYFINAAGDDWRPELKNLAVALGLKAENAPEAERQIRLLAALEEYLRARPEALVIFDFVKNPADLETDRAAGLVPASLGCRVLATTRRRHARFESIDVPVLPEDAAVKLLLSRRKAREPADDPRVAAIICRRFGAMPLAIALAAAFLGKNPDVSLAGYARRMERYGLLRATDTVGVTPEELATRHEATVMATLQSQWDALENADAREVLKTAALLDVAADIPQARLSLLTGLAGEAEEGFPVPLHDALREISALSFVEPRRERDGIRLEPLAWEFAKLKIDAPEAFAAACAERLGEALRDMDRLQKEVATRKIDEVLTDLRIGIKLAGDSGRARLEALSRPLDRESHCLRRWDPTKEPGFLLQQLRNRCLDMGIEEVRERAEAKLGEHRWSWLRERFPFSRDSAALLRTLGGHTGDVYDVAVTPDGRCAVSASYDYTLKVWELATGQVLRTLQGHTSAVHAVAVTSDGRLAVSASWDNTLKVWDLAMGQLLRTIQEHSDKAEDDEDDFWGGSVVNDVAVTSDGRFAVSASDDKDKYLKVWDLATGQLLRTLQGHTDTVNDVEMTPDGRVVVSASADNTLKVWELATGQLLRTLQGHTNTVFGVAVTPDGHFAVSGSMDFTLKVWELATGRLLRTLQGHTNTVTVVTVTSDGRFAISGSTDNTLKVWELATGQLLRTLQGHTSWVNGVSVTPDGRFAVSASGDQTLKVWDLATEPLNRTVQGHTKGVTSVALTADGRLAISASFDHTLKVWELATKKVLRTLEGHTSVVEDVAVTSDGRFAVSASLDKTLKVWDLATGQLLRTLQGHTESVNGVALTSDGRLAISASEDKTLKVWDLATGQLLRTIQVRPPEIEYFEDGEEVWPTGVNDVAVTSDGRFAVSASWESDKYLKVWDLTTGQLLRTLQGHTSAVHGVAVTPDGRFAVSASMDETLKVWDLATAQLLRTLQGHTGWVNGVSVTPDGRFAVSASRDKTLKVWDLRGTDQPITTLETHAFMECCAITADTRTILAGNVAGDLHILEWIPPSSS
ncbi:AAA family ATPase [Sorangium sp. So ce1000]|uniref:AAA family ATPase n=1 Tax=Sorangium sp. So ce1000 TaxID=3133325 RepID=UPI003F6069BC